MNISPVTPNFTGASETISISAHSAENKQKPFLYNEILAILKENKFPATFHSSKIDINIEDIKFQADKLSLLKKELTKRGIKFIAMA